MEEADYLCDRVAIMDNGRFVALDSPRALKDLMGGDVVSLEVEGDPAVFLDEFREVDWVKTRSIHEDAVVLTMERGERRIPEIVLLAQQKGLAVTCVHLRKPSLEDVFLHFTGRTIREREAGSAERNKAMMMGHGRR
jgi:ABC-2 type transport system ATP-binding protein